MERRTFLKLTGVRRARRRRSPGRRCAAPATVRWWYHFDNPQTSPAELIAKFEAANPGIKVAAENDPVGRRQRLLHPAVRRVVAGNAPDCAMVQAEQPGAPARDAGARAARRAWSPPGMAAADISDNIWTINKASDGKQYYLPLQYVVIYLYYRADMFEAAGLKPPKTFDEFLAAAKALTKDGVYGFGMRGGGGGYDNWGPFVLGGGANFAKGGMISEAPRSGQPLLCRASAPKHKVVPPSAPTDGFQQIIDQLQGRPHRHDHPPCRLVQRDGRGARRQGLGRAGAARSGRQGLDLFRRRVERASSPPPRTRRRRSSGSPSCRPARTTRPSPS